MQTLIFPGYSKSNQEWTDTVANSLKVEGEIRPFHWMHWQDESSHFDPEEKANLIVKHIRSQKVNIVAKSIGTLVACLVLNKVPDQVGKVILCGIPKNDLNAEGFGVIEAACSKFGGRIRIIQNNQDPHANIDEIKKLGNVLVKESNNHEYPYVSEFNKILAS